MKITKRDEIDPYTYQVGEYLVTEIPFGPKKNNVFGYSCQCGMMTTGYLEQTGDRQFYPCSHIKTFLVWKNRVDGEGTKELVP